MKQGVEFPGHMTVKATMERHLAMVYTNHMGGWLPCQDDTAKNLQTRWRCKRMATPPLELVASLPGRPSPPRPPSVPTGDTGGNKCYQIQGTTSSCVYMHSPLPMAQVFNHNGFAKDSKPDQDCIPDLLRTLSAVWKYR
jgi:hypothetical protein